MAVLNVSRPTVYTWFNRWERGGLAGLANAAGPVSYTHLTLPTN